MRKKIIFPNLSIISLTLLFVFFITTAPLPLQAQTQKASLPDIQKAKTYIEEGKLDEALSKLQEVIENYPEVGEAHLLLARIYEKKAKIFLDDAIAEYKKALLDEKVGPAARKNLAKLLMEKGEYKNVISFLSEVEREDFEVLKLLGISYFKLGQLTEALEKLEKAMKINPDNAEVLFTLAKIYENKRLFDDALTSYQKVVSLGPERLSTMAQKRIDAIRQQRKGLTVEDIKEPEVKKLVLTSPEAEDFPEAGAAILLNKHEYIVKEDKRMVEKIHKLIKIFNVRGREKYGEVNIDYDSTYQRVEVNLARTVKPDKTIVEVGTKDIKDIDRWAGFPLYSNAKVKVISMPEVVEGSIIEYKATIHTSRLINEDDFQFRFPLQYFEPVLHHRLILSIPKEKEVNIHYVRVKEEDKNPEVTETDNFRVYEWKIDNVPEIISEPDMPPWADVTPFIMVSSFTSWDELSTWWRNLSEGQPEPTAEIADKVEEITKGKGTQKQKATSIYHWIISNIRYVGLEFGVAGFKPHSAEEVFNNKYGDCKDKTTLLIAMYRVAGIPAHYALIGTRDMGKLEQDIPMSQFNHAICLAEVDGEKIFLDPTAETASFGEVPGVDQEKLSLVFLPEKAKFLRVPLKSPEENRFLTRMKVDIHRDASIKVQMELITSGATDMDFRSFKYIKPARRRQIVENWVNSLAPGAKLEGYSFSDLEDFTTPVTLKVTFFAPDYLKKAGEVYLFSIPGIQMSAQGVGKKKRKYPILFFTTSLSIDKVEINLPAQFEVKYTPEKVSIELPYISFNSHYETSDGTILYEGVLRRETTEITTSQYPEYKSFKEEAARQTQKQIVLGMKNPETS